MTEERVWIDVNPIAWRRFARRAEECGETSARRLGALVELIVRKELQADKARRQRAFRANAKARRDG